MSTKESPSVVFEKSPFKNTSVNGISYECPGWQQMGEVSRELASRINFLGERFDSVVTLPNGGFTWTKDIADRIGTLDILPMRLKSYTGINASEEIKLIYDLPLSVGGKRVLVLDDVADSGKTLLFAEEHIKKAGAREVKSATLCFKPRSIIKPDFCGFITDAWVIFPHEHREFIELSYKEWAKQGISKKEMRANFKKIGLPIYDVEEFMPRI